MPVTGDIALRARGEIPVTWDALARTTLFGDTQLQFRVDFIKYSTFATVVDPSHEASFYDPITLTYAGKMVALQLIPAGADYWADQETVFSEAANSSSESSTLPDHIGSLWRIHARLLAESVQLLKMIPAGVLGASPGQRRIKGPRLSDGPGQTFRTVDPNLFPGQTTDVGFLGLQISTDYPIW